MKKKDFVLLRGIGIGNAVALLGCKYSMTKSKGKRHFFDHPVFFGIKSILIAFFSVILGATASPTLPDDPNTVSIIDTELREPLQGVSAFNSDRTFVVLSDAKGQINIQHLVNSDTLHFHYTGYENVSHSIQWIRENGNLVTLQMETHHLGELVVRASSKFAERSDEVPSTVEVIDSKEIEFKNSQTSADMLGSTGSIFIQKSQMGGGSPIIRGFEANKVLIVIDGVRMNNAIYRNGHLQNVLSIDNAILDRTEIIYGPASVMYGSDALGGVMHFYTKDPKRHYVDDRKWDVHAFTRFSSANLERTAHVDFNYGNKKWASLTSVTGTQYDDLRSGSRKGKHLPSDFGDRDFYVVHENFKDTVYRNNKPRRQLGTKFSQFDVMQKVLFQPRDSLKFLLNLQYTTTTPVPRYDNLTEGEVVITETGFSKDFKYAEWKYGSQTRVLASFLTEVESQNPLFNSAKFLVAYQRLDEDRITRRYDVVWRKKQQEDVHVSSVNADLTKEIIPNRLRLLYGLETSFNYVKSAANQLNIATSLTEDRSITRYPDGGSKMFSAGAYVSLKLSIPKRNIKIVGGLRPTLVNLTSEFLDTAFFRLPDSRARLETRSLTGGVGMTWNHDKGYSLHVVGSTAFRAPNVDDFSKVRSNGGFVSIPNPNLVAEKTWNTEVTLAKNFNDRVKISGTSFYTYLSDVLVRRRDTLENGEQTLYFDGSFDTIQRNFNAGRGLIYGVSGNILVKIHKNLEFKTVLNFTYGHNITDDRPLSHIPPIYGQTSFTYIYKKARLELQSVYNGWKRTKRYDLDGSDNFDKATLEGTPPWYIFNLYSSFDIGDKFSISLSVENILDQHYRPFSSGVSAAGVNVMASLRAKF